MIKSQPWGFKIGWTRVNEGRGQQGLKATGDNIASLTVDRMAMTMKDDGGVAADGDRSCVEARLDP